MEEGLQYLEELLGSGPLGSALPGIDSIRDNHLQAFLGAKAAAAREAGVTLKIGENTWVSGRLELPVDVTTVVGNLLDNAIDAARTGSNPAKEVEIELLQEGSTLHGRQGLRQRRRRSRPTSSRSCSPKGPQPSRTRHPRRARHRIGLVTPDQPLAGRRASPSSPGNPAARQGLVGAEFIARLPGVMTEEEQWVEQI